MDAPTRTLLEVAEQSNPPPGPDLPLPPFEEFREITKPLVKMMEKLVTSSDEGFNVYSPPFLFYKLEMSRLIEDTMGRRVLQLASIFCKSPLIAKAMTALATSKETAAALTAVASSPEAGVVIASLSSSAEAASAMISMTSCQEVATGISAIATSPDAAVAVSGLVSLPKVAAAMARITSSRTTASALSEMAYSAEVRAAMVAIGSSLTISSAVATIASSSEAISVMATLLSLPDSARVISAMASSPETTLAALTSSPVEPASIAAITSSPDASEALAAIASLPEAAAALTAIMSSPEVVAVITQSPEVIMAILTALVLSSNPLEVATSSSCNSSVSKNVASVLKEIASLPELSAAIAAIISSPEGVIAIAALISSRDVAVAMAKMASSSKASAVMEAVASSPEASAAMVAIASSCKAAAALLTMSSLPEWVNLVTAIASSPESISTILALSCSPEVSAALKSMLSTPGLAEAVMMIMTASPDAAKALATGTPEAAISTVMAKAASHQDKIDPLRRAERQETCLNSMQQDTIDRLLSFTHTEVRESFVRVLDIFQGTESDAVLEQFQIVLGFLQSGGLTQVREQIRKSTAHLIEIGFMFQFIGVYGLDVQRKLMIEFPQIANLLTKFSSECYSVKSCLSYFSHYSIVQECLLRNGTLPSVVDDDDTLAGLILTDNRKIRNELMACNVSVDNPFVDAILKSKSATEDWKECCDKVAAHRRIAGQCCDSLLAPSSTTVQSATSPTTHTTTTSTTSTTSTRVDSGVLTELDAVASTAAGGASINGVGSSKTSTLSQYLHTLYSNKCLVSVDMIREECERQTSYIIRSCLFDMMGRYFLISDEQKLNSSTMYEEEDDDFSCSNAVDRMIFKSKLSQRVCYPALLADSPVSRYRNFAVTTTQLLLDQSLINEFPLFTRLSEWTLLKKRIPPWICSSNEELAANAREFVLKQNLSVPSLKSICLLKVSEYILQVQTQLHHLPLSLLKQLTPCTIE